jgi:hypothetical protein
MHGCDETNMKEIYEKLKFRALPLYLLLLNS